METEANYERPRNNLVEDRMINGQLHWWCSTCHKWKMRLDFSTDKINHIARICKVCRGEVRPKSTQKYSDYAAYVKTMQRLKIQLFQVKSERGQKVAECDAEHRRLGIELEVLTQEIRDKQRECDKQREALRREYADKLEEIQAERRQVDSAYRMGLHEKA